MNAASKRDKTSLLRPDSEGHHLQQTSPNVLIKEAAQLPPLRTQACRLPTPVGVCSGYPPTTADRLLNSQG